MPKAPMIPVKTFCVHHHIEFSIVQTMKNHGLVELISAEGEYFIPAGQLNEMEKLIRLYRDLDINPEGIDAIIHLLKRMKNLQEKINRLQNRLSLYENAE